MWSLSWVVIFSLDKKLLTLGPCQWLHIHSVLLRRSDQTYVCSNSPPRPSVPSLLFGFLHFHFYSWPNGEAGMTDMKRLGCDHIDFLLSGSHGLEAATAPWDDNWSQFQSQNKIIYYPWGWDSLTLLPTFQVNSSPAHPSFMSAPLVCTSHVSTSFSWMALLSPARNDPLGRFKEQQWIRAGAINSIFQGLALSASQSHSPLSVCPSPLCRSARPNGLNTHVYSLYSCSPNEEFQMTSAIWELFSLSSYRAEFNWK